MNDALLPYHTTFAALLALGVLFVLQLLIADLAGMRAGHVPGMPVEGGHEVFFWRATRALANTNEGLAAFLLLCLTAVFCGASVRWVNGLTCGFALARLGHMLAYYADQRIVRSTAFVAGVLCMFGLAAVAAVALF